MVFGPTSLEQEKNELSRTERIKQIAEEKGLSINDDNLLPKQIETMWARRKEMGGTWIHSLYGFYIYLTINLSHFLSALFET